MANLVIPRREIWTQQPQVPVEIDWSNPISAGLLRSYDFGNLGRDATRNGAAWWSTGSTQPAITTAGRGLKVAARGQLSSNESVSGQISTGITLFLIAEKNAKILSASDFIFGATTELDAGDFNWGFYESVSTGNLSGFVKNASNVSVNVTGGTNWLPDKGPQFWALTYGGGDNFVRLYLNGFEVGSAAQTGLIKQTALNARIAGWNAGSQTPGFTVIRADIWNRNIGSDGVARLSKYPWQIFAPRETRNLFVPVSVGGTTTVTSDSAAAYKVQGSIQSSSVAAYGIRSAIQSDSAVSYAIRASAQNDVASSYAVRGSTQQSSAPTYLILGLVDQTVTASYVLRTAVSSDASATYNTLSATSVSASTSAGYSIRGSINQDVAASYVLRGAVTQDTSATYSILSASAVSSSVTAGYAIKGSVQSSIVAGYSIAQAVQAEIAASYIVRSGAVSEAQATYVIRGLVQQSVAASYAIDGTAFTGSISDEDITRIVQAVLAALNATTIPVNIKQVNSITIKGAGVTGNTWGPL